MKKKYLYITIENINRELNAKLLIANEAIGRGYNVIIGSKDIIWSIVDYLIPGPILEKSLGKNLRNIVIKNYKLKFTIFLLDEESLTYASKKQYLYYNFYKNNQKYLTNFFLSNNKQRKMLLSDNNINKKKLILTGTPKYELYKKKYRKLYEKEVKNILKKYGKFILITSRFGNVNHNKINTDSLKNLDKNYQNFSSKIFYLFLEMTLLLAKNFSKIKIIYRPHPSENINYVRSKLNKYKNINVIYEGNVVPWIIASKILVHNKCTTGFEGLLLDKKVVHYDPFTYKSLHNSFFKILGYRCKKISQVIEICKKIIAENYTLKNNYNKKIFNEYYCDKKEAPQSLIMNQIDKKYYYSSSDLSFIKLLILKIIHIKKNIKIFIYCIFSKNFKNNYNYINQKFGIISKSLINQKLSLINKILKLNYNFKIKVLCKNTFHISKN